MYRSLILPLLTANTFGRTDVNVVQYAFKELVIRYPFPHAL